METRDRLRQKPSPDNDTPRFFQRRRQQEIPESNLVVLKELKYLYSVSRKGGSNFHIFECRCVHLA